VTRLLEATLKILAWSIFLGWGLWTAISWMDNSFDWNTLPLVIPAMLMAWGAGTLRQRRLYRPRFPQPPQLENLVLAAAPSDPPSGPNGGLDRLPAGSGASGNSLNDRVRTWACARCQKIRRRSGYQRCDRCGYVTETVWQKIEFWPCTRCGRETSMTDPFCDRCRRVPMGHERPQERTEHKNAQLSLW